MDLHRPAATPRRRWAAAVAGTGLALTLGLSACVPSGGSKIEERAGASASAAQAAQESIAPETPLTPDIEFATAMIKNQEQAVDFSRLLLDKDGVDGFARDIAQGVVDDSPATIAQLDGMLNGWGVGSREEAEASAAPVPTPTPEAAPVAPGTEDAETVVDVAADVEAQQNGLLTSNERRVLEMTSGEDASRIYLLQLKRLYQGGRMIAATEVEEGSDDAATALARDLQRRFESDISRMQTELGEQGVIAGGDVDRRDDDETDENESADPGTDGDVADQSAAPAPVQPAPAVPSPVQPAPAQPTPTLTQPAPPTPAPSQTQTVPAPSTPAPAPSQPTATPSAGASERPGTSGASGATAPTPSAPTPDPSASATEG